MATGTTTTSRRSSTSSQTCRFGLTLRKIRPGSEIARPTRPEVRSMMSIAYPSSVCVGVQIAPLMFSMTTGFQVAPPSLVTMT